MTISMASVRVKQYRLFYFLNSLHGGKKQIYDVKKKMFRKIIAFVQKKK